MANVADRLRDKAIILFGWATGARVGEVFKTQYKDRPLLWKDLEFREDKIWVTLDGKTGEREIPVKTSKPVMEDYWDSCKADLDEPVFRKENSTSLCPECNAELNLKGTKCAYEDREYRCPECSWEGPIQQVKKKKKALTANAVRRIVRKLVKRADLKGEFDDNPHDFLRKARAIYKVRVGYTEHQLRAFFGWSETSDAPKHYISLVKEDLEKALAEEFGEEVEYDNGYDEDALRPLECVSCGRVNSATNDLCKECGNALNEQGEQLTKENSMQPLEKKIGRIAEEENLDQEELMEMFDKPFMDVVREFF